MKYIPLTQGKFAIVDDEDYEWLMQWKWYAHKSRNSWRAVRSIRKGKTNIRIYMSRAIMNAPLGKCVDHINHRTLDNRKCNLRICTYSENSMNQFPQKNRTSKFKGVYWSDNGHKWRAHIQYNGKQERLGYFKTEIEAAKAYNEKAKELFGNFAYVNRI